MPLNTCTCFLRHEINNLKLLKCLNNKSTKKKFQVNLWVLFVSSPQNNWLHEQHDWNAKKCDQNQKHLNSRLSKYRDRNIKISSDILICPGIPANMSWMTFWNISEAHEMPIFNLLPSPYNKTTKPPKNSFDCQRAFEQSINPKDTLN